MTLGASYWWLYWAVLTPAVSFGGFYVASWTTPFVFLLSELVPSAVFGLYVADTKKFGVNLFKALLIFTTLFLVVLVFQKMAMVVAPVVILALMWGVKLTKKEAKWMFGSVVLYNLCGVPSLFLLPFFADHGALFVVGYVLKGALFGIVMSIVYRRLSKEGEDVVL